MGGRESDRFIGEAPTSTLSPKIASIQGKGELYYFLKECFWHFPSECNSSNANHQFVPEN